ncbi:response regulator transcription factor [Sutcliffiella horikoshii]|uniref:response regulator transcription factor n=1 Tax=Sutcliffiella horikoshii TaxID=79883 RepID=UPI00203E9B98|nr:response regulator transcription factor [Sutcliffiella horikoshii]MCM3618566.1 response regulator transcription factor [Sutcliffiella horikoshii]
MKILIVEDDINIRSIIQMYMSKQGYETIVAVNGEEALELYYGINPDCIILDLMLPEMDGWEVCKLIRLDDPIIPIIMLTGKGESYDIVKGLELGADDYIVKPFDPNELSARVKAALRRVAPSNQQRDIVQLKDFMINLQDFRLRIGSKDVKLAPKELELLYYFAYHHDQVLSKQQLLDKIWGYDFDGDPRTIDVHIKRVRDKLSSNGSTWSITTIRGVGYRFEEKPYE